MNRLPLVCAVALFLFAAWIFTPAAPSQAEAAKGFTIRWSINDTDLRASFSVIGLPAADLERLKAANLKPELWQQLFAVYAFQSDTIDQNIRDRPAMLGTYRIVDGALRFEPRFPLVGDVTYRTVFHPSRLPGRKDNVKPEIVSFTVPGRKREATTVVEQVYPTAGNLPENQLRFYFQFSAPMSRGEVYKHIRLLDAAGKTIADPFLELGEELWDPKGVRFTLLVDPGRIKRGLKPREEVGPVLEDGKCYTLVIDAGWPDAQGNPLKQGFRKSLRAGPPIEKAIDPAAWKIAPPPPGGTAALEVTFPRPLDHALLQRLLWVVDARGQKLAGTIKVSDQERRWQFIPEKPWSSGSYQLVADTTLEDLAGNSIRGPFEVDVERPIQKLETTMVQLPFSCK